MAVHHAYDRHDLVITIDGPAGTGKTTVAHLLARRLGLEFLDTGAMYRAAALLALERGLDPEEGPAIAAALRDAPIRFDWSQDPPTVRLGGRDVSRRIRDLDVSAIVSPVAACAEVRAVLVEAQRRIGVEHPRLVSEGRDQGSVVFPDAPVRFFLTADPDVRAQRRIDQLRAEGRTADADAIRADIRERDRIDSTRAVGPLRRPEGAIVVDCSHLARDEVVERLESLARERLPGLAPASAGCAT